MIIKIITLLTALMMYSNLHSQNITNTFGIGGIYVKKASASLLTLKESNGLLGLGTIPGQQLGSKTENKLNAGFIALELDETQTKEEAEWLGLVNKDNPGKIEAAYGNLLPVMVKAIQELKAENDKMIVESGKLKVESAQLKNENEELKQNNEKLSLEVESLKSMNDKIVKLEKMVIELTSTKLSSFNKVIENKTISNTGGEK